MISHNSDEALWFNWAEVLREHLGPLVVSLGLEQPKVRV